MSFKVKLPCMYDEERLLPNDFNVCGKNYFDKKLAHQIQSSFNILKYWNDSNKRNIFYKIFNFVRGK